MRKEWIICGIVIICVLIVNIITQKYTEKSIEIMDEKLEIIKQSLSDEDIEYEKVKEQMNEAMYVWRERYEVLAYFIEHDELEKVETELTSLDAHICTQEYKEGVTELEKSIFILNHIKDKSKLDIKNIF